VASEVVMLKSGLCLLRFDGKVVSALYALAKADSRSKASSGWRLLSVPE
jgi:hypothetical protein